MKNRFVFIFSLVGGLIALYILNSYQTATPLVCLSGSGCEIVRKSPYANPFGIPVPAIGVAGFASILGVSFLLSLKTKYHHLLTWLLKAITLLGLIFVISFTYIEIFLIRAICSWCVFSAAIITIIFILAWHQAILRKLC